MYRFAASLILAASWASTVAAQSGCQLVPQTILEPRTVTAYRWESQTEYENRQVTVAKPVLMSETRQRTVVSFKPVTRQRILEETYEVQKPIVETSEREQEVQETVYESATEIQSQQVYVDKPVIETQFRDEQVIVRKPVTQTIFQTENVTTYKPVTVNQTVLMPSSVAFNQQVTDPLFANRLQWLRPGYYVDPLTGLARWQRPGLHWVPNPPLVQTVVQPAYIPQQQLQTTYIPEVVQQQTPVQVTAYQDVVETRRVPYQVQKMERVVETRQVPVVVRRPVIRTRMEKVPVSSTRYETQTVVRRTPIEETTYERVETVEPYQVQVEKWVNETSTVQVPKQVLRRVEYPTTEYSQRTVWHRVPVDAFGNLLYHVPPTVVLSAPRSSGTAQLSADPATPTNSVLQSQSTVVAKPPVGQPASGTAGGEITGQWQILRKPASLNGMADPELNGATLKQSRIVDDPQATNVPETPSGEGNSVLEPIKDPTSPAAADQAPALPDKPADGESSGG